MKTFECAAGWLQRRWVACLVAGLVVLSGLWSGCRPPASEYSEGVELLLSGQDIGPAASFELRFEQSMVTLEQVGVGLSNSPLVISPRLAGTFTWLSPRSACFTPEEPLGLDCRYELTLRSGLLNAEGKPAKVALHRVVSTPPFSLVGSTHNRSSTNASSLPEVALLFNAPVQAAQSEAFLYFVDAAGRRRAAQVRQATLEERPSRYELGSPDSLRTWQEQFAALRPSKAGSPLPVDEDELAPTNQVANLLLVSPRQALGLGKGWRLVLGSGLPEAQGQLHLRKRSDIPIGDVTPFVFVEGSVHNVMGSRPSLSLDFSKPLNAALTNLPSEWLQLSPLPEDLQAQVMGRRLLLQGAFKSRTNYQVKLFAGLAAAEPFSLGQALELEVNVPPVAPRLYFPAFSREQLAGGNRTLPLLAVNVSKLRLRAKLLEPQTAIHALRGYGSYFRAWSEREESEESYRRVDYNLVPGRTVFNQELAGSKTTDEAQTLTLRWDELLGGRKSGVLFLEAERLGESDVREPPLGTQALLQLTDLGLVWKRSAAQVQAFVFSYTTGQPVSGASVSLLGAENELLGQAQSDGAGQVRLASNTNACWLAAQQGEDFHVLALDAHRLNLYGFHLPFEPADEAEEPRRLMLFSERGVYRVGETLHLKALARQWGQAGLSIPSGLSGTLQCIDARGRKFFETNAAFNSLGAWAGSLPLSSEARGSYQAVLHLGDKNYDYTFQVQDFQPDAFELSCKAKAAYGPDEAIEVPVTARYFFGKSLARAQLKWWLEARDWEFKPEGFEGFQFRRDPLEERFARGASSLSVNGQSMLLGGSNCVIAPPVACNPVAPQPRMASLLVEVTDLNQQTLSRRVEFFKHSSAFYLGLRQSQAVVHPGQELGVEAVAVDAQGQPWPEGLKVHLKLQRLDWQSVRLQGAGRSIRYRNEVSLTNLLERDIELPAQPRSASKAEPFKGMALGGLSVEEAGQYLLEISATDPAGHPVVSSREFVVSAAELLAWDYHSEVQLKLKADKASYQPGQSAELLLEAPFSGTALVTIERERVLRSFLAHLEGNAPSIRVPIESNDVPNVFVSVTLVRGSADCPREVKEPDYRVGYCQLSVESPQTRLEVQVSCSASNYLPAAPVELSVQLKDGLGAVVPEAEVTLYAVDEGILSLTEHAVPEPHDFFYAARQLGVRTSLSLPNLLSEDPEEVRFENKGYLGGDGGDIEHLRKNFLACAFWNAELRSGPDGKVSACFAAPDGLTRYRVVAVAHTARSCFGSGQASFQVSKPLMLEPALPRFANITDQLVARALVQNQSEQAGQVLVSLQLDEHATAPEAVAGLLSRRVNVAAHGSAVAEFAIRLLEPGSAQWTWKARFAEGAEAGFTDAVQSRLPVGFVAPLLREVFLGRAKQEQTNLLSGANPQLLAGRGSLSVQVANTRLLDLGESLGQLLHYPYGCAEQTGSSLLPWLLVGQSAVLCSVAGRQTNEIQHAIEVGIARFLSMQTSSGGLSYWPHQREPMFWASAYGGLILALAQQRGVAVPAQEFGRLQEYLSKELRSDSASGSSPDESCLALYALALAGKPEAAYHEKFFALRQSLSKENRALLALAILQSQGSDAMASQLLGPKSGPGRPGPGMFGGPARERAIELLACTRLQPESPLVDSLVSDLMHEQQQGQWASTQGNAWALLALSEYARLVEAKLEPAQGELRWGEQHVAFRLEGTNQVFSHRFDFQTNGAGAALGLSLSQGRVFTSVTLEARPPVDQQPRQERGFSLQRQYSRLDEEQHALELAGLRVGERVLVTLHLGVSRPASFVVIDDALPANLEAINPEFKSQEAAGANALAAQPLGLDWRSDYRELRTERVLYFANQVEPGNYVLRYLARVRAAGSVTAPSAKVEEMYHPGRYGLSGSQPLSSQASE